MRARLVLVADDERHTRVALSLIFKRAGFQVTTVEDGAEALRRVTESLHGAQPFDLLVLDVQMPGLTGLEVVEELRRLEFRSPILLITGYRERERAEELGRHLCLEYAEKPFQPEDLMRQVDRVLERFARERGMTGEGAA